MRSGSCSDFSKAERAAAALDPQTSASAIGLAFPKRYSAAHFPVSDQAAASAVP
jgi:hypothetical protein